MTGSSHQLTVYEWSTPVGPSAPELKGKHWWGTIDRPSQPGAIGHSQIGPQWLQDRPFLLISDVDSTLLAEEVIDELAALAGVGAKVAELTERAMAGNMDFSDSLVARAQQLRGLPATAFDEVRARLHVRPGAQTLVDWVHSLGGQVGLVSGGFTPVVAQLSSELGIDHHLAIDLEVRDGALTGAVEGPIVTARTKLEFLTRLREQTGLPVVALGDGANDLLMLGAADVGIGIGAKPIVRQSVANYLEAGRLDPVIGLLGHSEI